MRQKEVWVKVRGQVDAHEGTSGTGKGSVPLPCRSHKVGVGVVGGGRNQSSHGGS